jgi:hypothetical protein
VLAQTTGAAKFDLLYLESAHTLVLITVIMQKLEISCFQIHDIKFVFKSINPKRMKVIFLKKMLKSAISLAQEEKMEKILSLEF